MSQVEAMSQQMEKFLNVLHQKAERFKRLTEQQNNKSVPIVVDDDEGVDEDDEDVAASKKSAKGKHARKRSLEDKVTSLKKRIKQQDDMLNKYAAQAVEQNKTLLLLQRDLRDTKYKLQSTEDELAKAKQTLENHSKCTKILLDTASSLGDHNLRLLKELQDKQGKGGAESSQCAVCLDRSPEVVYLPCRHLGACHSCELQMSERKVCPVCNTPTAGKLHVFV